MINQKSSQILDFLKYNEKLMYLENICSRKEVQEVKFTSVNKGKSPRTNQFKILEENDGDKIFHSQQSGKFKKNEIKRNLTLLVHFPN